MRLWDLQRGNSKTYVEDNTSTTWQEQINSANLINETDFQNFCYFLNWFWVWPGDGTLHWEHSACTKMKFMTKEFTNLWHFLVPLYKTVTGSRKWRSLGCNQNCHHMECDRNHQDMDCDRYHGQTFGWKVWYLWKFRQILGDWSIKHSDSGMRSFSWAMTCILISTWAYLYNRPVYIG